ncbi:MAG: damage-inducible protein DinB [Mesorhizobium amorphae]|nr:MAG: damage-inducible protein DinB [Mesorhizobium amorphae]
MSKRIFEMMAAYNAWANARVLDAAAELSEEEWLRDTGAFFGSVMRTLNHLLVADRIWLHRFTNQGQTYKSLDLVLHKEFAALREARQAEDARIVRFIDELTEATAEGRFTYTTVTDMRTVSQRLAPALMHVFNHQTHHRGQVHAILTGLGRPSITLDLAFFQRAEGNGRFA